MSDSIADLLARKDFDEPAEMRAIKTFVRDVFDEPCEVLLRDRDIVVTVSSSSLANALRLKMNDLRKAAKIERRIVLRIR
jgi:hypothetical protein